MAWTSPTTVVSGTLITSSWGNTYVRDNSTALRETPANRCSAFDQSAQNVTDGNTDNIALDSESYDTATMHDTSTNNERIVIPAGGGGFYLVFAHTRVEMGNNVTDAEVQLCLNGSAVEIWQREIGSASNIVHTATIAYARTCSAADYFSLKGSSSGGTTLFGSATSTRASRLTVIGPLPPS